MQKGCVFVLDAGCRDWLWQHARSWLVAQLTMDKATGLWQMPIGALSAVRRCLRVGGRSHVWIHENGHRHNRLKNRQLAYVYSAKPTIV